MSKLLVIIAGPTASGKTRLAIDLALHFKTEIISADSRQFYKEITIGTAKPSEAELRLVKHHFINSHTISQPVTAGIFGQEVNKLLPELFKNNDVVIMSGGSGLYINAVIHGIEELPPANATMRDYLEKQYAAEGITALQDQLNQLDPEGYQQIDINNPRRLIRAIEISQSSGRPYSTMIGRHRNSMPYDYLMAGIDWPRNELYDRINARTGTMIRDGLKEEAAAVIHKRTINALSTVGYKEMFDHLDGKTTLEEAAYLIAQHTRNYAKRQVTWFKRYPEMLWMQPGKEMQLVDLIEIKMLK